MGGQWPRRPPVFAVWSWAAPAPVPEALLEPSAARDRAGLDGRWSAAASIRAWWPLPGPSSQAPLLVHKDLALDSGRARPAGTGSAPGVAIQGGAMAMMLRRPSFSSGLMISLPLAPLVQPRWRSSLDWRCSSRRDGSVTSVKAQRRSMNGTILPTRADPPGSGQDRPDLGVRATRRPGDGWFRRSRDACQSSPGKKACRPSTRQHVSAVRSKWQARTCARGP